MKSKKIKVILLLIYIIIYISISSSSTLNNTLLESVGLNTTINLTFQITYDELIITLSSLELYNLSYTHPNSCNSQISNVTLFNYTTQNQSLTSSQAFSSINCVGGGDGSKNAITEIKNITKIKGDSEKITNKYMYYGILFVVSSIGFIVFMYFLAKYLDKK